MLTTCALLLVLATRFPTAWAQDGYEGPRQAMLQAIERGVQATAAALGRAELSLAVQEALARVPRHLFVPADQGRHAYENRPLPIGLGQTISQPYIVAIMTELLEPKPDHRVLEVGTGSGYQAAVLSLLVKQVYSIEIVEPLGREAQERLQRLGYANVEVRIGDGYRGWPEAAPFDGILVTAAADRVPPELIAQLKPGGRLIMPVGEPGRTQELTLIHRQEDGSLKTREVLPVVFVPLTGDH